ncbi:glycosyltransferase family 2 protein [Zunongwangia sp. H14]|uniref:glycosyltransferase family 2 protein n=1 Tax=Zunongwangia sp. H14 TaxID=3240792 RepID=UPI003561A64C
MNPKISIIIACYNDPDVVRAVESAAKQTYMEKEIIVIDDGSDAQTKKAIKAVTDSIDVLITQKNQGQSIARNNGIAKTSGEYILNLDSDDFFEPSFCEKAVKLMQEDPEVKIVTCQARRFTKEKEIDIYTPAGGDYRNFMVSNSALGSSMFRKADWEACGGYETELPILGFEDWEFYLNILKNGGRAEVIKKVLFNYQVGKNSTTTRIKNLKHEKFGQIVFKHKDLYIEHFDLLVNELFARLNKEENEKMKISDKLDFRIGSKLLAPLRSIKKLLK